MKKFERPKRLHYGTEMLSKASAEEVRKMISVPSEDTNQDKPPSKRQFDDSVDKEASSDKEEGPSKKK